MSEDEQVDDRVIGGRMLSHQEPRVVDEDVYKLTMANLCARVDFCATGWAAVVLF